MSISRNTFDSTKRYLKVIKQQGTPGVDSEVNELQDILKGEMRGTFALVQDNRSFLNSGTGYYGFWIAEKVGGNSNNFTVKAGELMVDGYRVLLQADIDYTAQLSFTSLTPPVSGTRVDEVYAEVSEEEIGVAQDVNIALQTASGQIETSKRLQQTILVKVAAGSSTPASDATYKRLLLARITRDTSAQITDSMITNLAHLADAPLTPSRVTVETGYDEQNIQSTVNLGFSYTRVRSSFVKADWGDAGTGTGGSGTFVKTANRVGAWTTNEWIGFTLVDSDGNEFVVISNTADTLTVNGTPATGDFTVGSNADEYVVVLVPVINGVIQWARAQQRVIDIKGIASTNLYSVQMGCEFNALPSGVTYNVYVASKGNDNARVSRFSAAASIATGLATQLVMPSVSARQVNYGVEITWPTLTGAIAYEVAWNTDNVIADFGNPRHYTFVTSSTGALIKGLAGEIIQVAVRAVDGSGQISENTQLANAQCGGVALEQNTKIIGPIYFSKIAADNTKVLRKILEFPTENGVEIVRLAVYVADWTCGTPCTGGLNDGKIRVYRSGDESSSVNVVTDSEGLKDQVATRVIQSAGVLVVDAWDPLWDTSAPTTYPIVAGYVMITYREGEFITQITE